MKDFLSQLKGRNLLFMVTMIIAMGISQAVIQYDLNKQNRDAELINLAGRQRMLSQRISKVVLYLQREGSSNQFPQHRLDTLRSLINTWATMHHRLLHGDDVLGKPSTEEIRSLLEENTPRLEKITTACQQLLEHPTAETVQAALNVITTHEYPFLRTMEATVWAYQQDAENKLRYIKSIEIWLGVLVMIVVAMNFFFIMMPAMRRLESSNQELSNLNNELIAVNEELQSSEEELRTNLDQISALQEHLEVSERQYRELVENINDMVYELDEQGRFAYVNPVMEKITGYSKKQLLKRPYWELVDEQHRESVVSFYRRQRQTHQEHSYHEFVILSAEAKNIWVGQTVRMQFDEGRVTRVSVMARDITMIRQTQALLQQEKEKAEAATVAKAQFLSVMSHEIRTPMNAIVGMTNLLLMENPRPDQQENMKLLRFSAENLLTIINDILDFSKIEAGKVDLESIPFNLPELIDNVVRTLKPKADEKQIVLLSETGDQVPTFVLSDPVRISQMLLNLVSNAIKFTHEGQVKIRVDRTGNDEPAQVLFSVEDTGIGISADHLEKIFESFTQASSDTTRKFGGTGLGLSITKRLVELLGGTLTVTSTPGQGSCFAFSLPLSITHAPHTNAVPMLSFSDTALQGVRILLVEDNPINQLVAKKFLSNWGIDLTIANNGREATEKIQARNFDLILMDLQMPEMDGFTATRTIRSWDDPYFRTVPILALTAAATSDSRQEVLESGMNDFIVKPFQPETLFEKIAGHAPSRRRPTLPLLHQYSEGDATFRKELVGHLINGITELTETVVGFTPGGDVQPLKESFHKHKTTLEVLEAADLQAVGMQMMNDILENQLSQEKLLRYREAFISRHRELVETLRQSGGEDNP
jgi:PAS domain S-box-containing protein